MRTHWKKGARPTKTTNPRGKADLTRAVRTREGIRASAPRPERSVLDVVKDLNRGA